MLDMKRILDNPEEVKKQVITRNDDPAKIDRVIELNESRKKAQKEADELRNKRNALSKEIGALKSKGQNADGIMAEVASMKDKLATLEAAETETTLEIEKVMATIPNLTLPEVPVGKDEMFNVEVPGKRWGEPAKFDFEPMAHFDIAEKLGIVDFARGAKVAGSGFILYSGLGARLERALIQFMLDLHTGNGFTEKFVPFMVNADSLYGTGQLPKFEQDLYHIEGESLYMNPTAEVPLINIYRDEILEEDELPIRMTAYAPSFRKEAGSYGKDTRGLIRVHQFNKVELIKLAKPEDSEAEHQSMLDEAELTLRKLGLPYRVITLSTGDTGFSSAKTYDIEVWLPTMGKYKEISSVSNCMDFQARRGNIRFRRKEIKKVEFVHTLNGSGVAVGRTMVAILENFQRKDGSVAIPEVLQPYMNGIKEIR